MLRLYHDIEGSLQTMSSITKGGGGDDVELRESKIARAAEFDSNVTTVLDLYPSHRPFTHEVSLLRPKLQSPLEYRDPLPGGFDLFGGDGGDGGDF